MKLVIAKRNIVAPALVALGFALAQAPGTARAAEPTAAEVKLARELGNAGIDAFEAGDYDVAAEKLDKAYALNPVPTLGWWSGRAFERTGQLVAASERWRAVVQMEAGDSELFQKAIADARKALPEIEKRIPRIEVRIEGAEKDDVQVTINGTPVSRAMLDSPIPVDPGRVQLTAKAGERNVVQTAKLAEGERNVVTLRIPVDGASPKPTPVPEPQADPATPKDTSPGPAQPEDVAGASSGPPALVWVALGVGVVGVGVGAVTGMLAKSKEDDLNEDCPEKACEPMFHGDVDSMNRLATTSTIAFIVGGAGFVGAGALWWFGGDEPERGTATRVQPFVGFGSAGVRGAF